MNSLMRRRLLMALPSALRLLFLAVAAPWILTSIFGGPLPDVSILQAVGRSTHPEQLIVPSRALLELSGTALWLIMLLAEGIVVFELGALLLGKWITPKDYLYPLHRMIRADLVVVSQTAQHLRTLAVMDVPSAQILRRATTTANADRRFAPPEVPPETESFEHVVHGRGREREHLRQLAARYYDDPDLWHLIADANRHRIQPDGLTLGQTRGGLHEGWILVIPRRPRTSREAR